MFRWKLRCECVGARLLGASVYEYMFMYLCLVLFFAPAALNIANSSFALCLYVAVRARTHGLPEQNKAWSCRLDRRICSLF